MAVLATAAMAAAALVAGPGQTAAWAAAGPNWEGAVAQIPAGMYYVTMATNPANTHSLDVSNAGTADGTKVQIWQSNQTVAQKWAIQRGSDGYYTFQNPNSGKYLDVVNAGTANGTSVQIWPGNNTCAQKWSARYDTGHYVFSSACSGKYLDVENDATANGTKVQLWDGNGSVNQKWDLVLATDNPLLPQSGTYALQTNNPHMVLDGGTGNQNDGAYMSVLSNSGAAWQRFTVTRYSGSSGVGVGTLTYHLESQFAGQTTWLASKDANQKDGTLVMGGLLNKPSSFAWSSWSVVPFSDICKNGYVWRGAYVADHVCVSTATRSQVASDNAVAASRWTNGAYGAHTCVNGYVWREAFTGDDVCVTTAQRTQAASDNTAAISRLNDSSYVVFNTQQGYALDAQGAGTINGGAVRLWDNNGTAAQKWSFIKV